MSKRDWRLFVEDLLESIALIETYTEGYQEDDFVADQKSIDAEELPWKLLL